MLIHEIFDSVKKQGSNVYEFETDEPLLTNTVTMQFYIDYLTDIQPEHIVQNDGTQVILRHPDYPFEVQLDASGRGDFCTHRIDITKVEP